MRFRLWVVAAGMLALLSVGCRPGTLTGNGAPDAVAADAPGASDAGQLPPADGAPPTSDSAAPADGAPQPPADNGAPPPPPPADGALPPPPPADSAPPPPPADSAPPPPPADSAVPADAGGGCTVPTGAQPESSSNPTTVVGTGTPQSCTSAAFVSAVAKGGVITFNCGSAPVTITLTQTAKIVNDTGPDIVIDGGGKVTLSGGDQVRILYMNTCDQAQKWTTSHCQDQDHPRLTVQNLTFIRGNAKGQNPAGGGAIFVRGGRFKIINSKFHNNVCDDVGPDVGGAAVRVLDQYQDLPVYIVGSTFGGGPTLGNVCSNGGGISSIGVSYSVYNSLFSYNRAIGNGANPAKPGTPGGGSGGAIYNDGNLFTLTLCGVDIHNNTANEGGGAIFFVSNNGTGSLVIRDSTLSANPSGQFETAGYPGIFFLGKGTPQVINSTLTP